MSREPPRNVYSNNRLRKIAPAPNPITRHQTADGVKDFKLDRSLHFNKSQSKYQKHFEQNASHKTLAPKRLNESPDAKKLSLNLNLSHQGELGIPLAHNYVRRKVPNNTQSIQPTQKKPRKNFDYSEQQSCSLSVNRDRLHSNSENPSWVQFQDSPKRTKYGKLSCASEFFTRVKATLSDTYEDVAEDNPKLKTALKYKEELLHKLRCFIKLKQEQKMVEDQNMDDTDDCISESVVIEPFKFQLPQQLMKNAFCVPFGSMSNRSQDFSVYSAESDEEKTPQPFKKRTPNCGANTSIPAAYGFKSFPTQPEILSHLQREVNSIGSNRLTPDPVSSKGPSSVSLDRNLSLNPNLSQDYLQEKSESFDTFLPMLNQDEVPYDFWHSGYYSSRSRNNSNNWPY